MANIINAASHTAIMNELKTESYTDLIDAAVEYMSSGCDLAVLISKKPLEASIAANRTSKLRAVVCGDNVDAVKARKARANMIILDDSEFTKPVVSNILRGWFGATAEIGEEPELEANSIDIGKIGKSAISALNSSIGIIKGQSGKKPKEWDEETEEDEGDMKKPKGKGIVKDIKYIFGIE